MRMLDLGEYRVVGGIGGRGCIRDGCDGRWKWGSVWMGRSRGEW